jgi:radical SAM modification target selenobiotic family peptide
MSTVESTIHFGPNQLSSGFPFFLLDPVFPLFYTLPLKKQLHIKLKSTQNLNWVKVAKILSFAKQNGRGGEMSMDKKELKKLLAGFSIAGLLTGGALVSTGVASDGKSS